MSEVFDEDLRKVGFTAMARRFPRSERGFRYICRLNGVDPEKAPHAWRYASSQWMLDYVEKLAAGSEGERVLLENDGSVK